MSDDKQDPPRVSVDEALDVARKASGPTLLVIVGPMQAERLYLALQIADKLVAHARNNIGRERTYPSHLDGSKELIARYAELMEQS